MAFKELGVFLDRFFRNDLNAMLKELFDAVEWLMEHGGGNGGGDMPLMVVAGEWEGTTSTTRTFADNVMGISIANKSESVLVLTVNGFTIQVDPGETFDNLFEPFKSVSITANGSYKALVTRPYGGTIQPGPTDPTNPPTDTTPPILTITPAASFTTSQSVVMSTNEAATIYYTLDGTTPTESSLVYSNPLTLSQSTTVKAFAKDTAGNKSIVQSVAYTKGTEPTTQIIVSDTFTRLDNENTLGLAETGQTWESLKGPWGIISNRAASLVTTVNGLVVVDSGVSDCYVEVKYPIVHATNKLVFRCSDDLNYLYLYFGALHKFEGGTSSKLIDFTTPPPQQQNGDVWKVKLNGESVIVYANGVELLSTTVTFNQTATKHGFNTNNTMARFDDFKVSAL